MRNLDEKGLIQEPVSKNYGKFPDSDTPREVFLEKWAWLWLMIPIFGLIPYTIVRKELTDRWGHFPWWM
jgi:hypothetical protein